MPRLSRHLRLAKKAYKAALESRIRETQGAVVGNSLGSVKVVNPMNGKTVPLSVLTGYHGTVFMGKKYKKPHAGYSTGKSRDRVKNASLLVLLAGQRYTKREVLKPKPYKEPREKPEIPLRLLDGQKTVPVGAANPGLMSRLIPQVKT